MGKETAFPGSDALGVSDIRDGCADTIMAVEVDDDHAVIWTKPEDLPFDAANPAEGLAKLPKAGFWAVLCDGSVRWIPNEFDPKYLRAAFTPSGWRSDRMVTESAGVPPAPAKSGRDARAPDFKDPPDEQPPLRPNRQRQIFRGGVLDAQIAVEHSIRRRILDALQLVPADDAVLVAELDPFAQVTEAVFNDAVGIPREEDQDGHLVVLPKRQP